MTRPTFQQRVTQMMARSGKSFRECCRILGSHGGKAAAAAKRRRKVELERQKAEVNLQEAMGLR